jgi:hypothetical protein
MSRHSARWGPSLDPFQPSPFRLLWWASVDGVHLGYFPGRFAAEQAALEAVADIEAGRPVRRKMTGPGPLKQG